MTTVNTNAMQGRTLDRRRRRPARLSRHAWLLLGLAAPLAGACGMQSDVDQSSPGAIESQNSALSVPFTQVLGFEDPSLWTVSSGTKSSSTTRTQGVAALAVSQFSYTELNSVQLGTLVGTTATMFLDVRPPSSPAWGQIQLFVSIPSRGVFNQPSNSVTIANLPGGAYSTLTFTLPGAVTSALAQTYGDLTFKVAVSAPQAAQSTLFDNLRFQGTVTPGPQVDPAQVLGFENPSTWAVSSGTKSSSADRTQGVAALAVGQFAYTELTSVQLVTLAGTTSTMLLDVKPPSTPAWGQIQLFVSIPSRGVFNQPSNSVTIMNLPGGTYSTLLFTLPSSVASALAQTYGDLTFKVTVSAPQAGQSTLFDNLRFQTSTTSLVEMRASNVDDFLYVTIDGVRRKVFYLGDPSLGARADVSAWFGAGLNTIRLQNVNEGGPSSYQFELWVDGQQIVNDAGPANVTREGIATDKTMVVDTTNRPAFQAVSFTSAAPGKLYVNDTFMGLDTPVSLTLPQGRYTFGLGVGTDTPFAYTGSYYEQTVNVGPTLATLNLTANGPLPVQKTNSMVIVPVRNTNNWVTALGRADASNAGILVDSDVPLLLGQLNATRDVWVKPFSYGLATWSIAVVPTVTSVPLVETPSDVVNPFDTDGFLVAAGLTSLKQQYDRVVIYFSQQKADGTDVADPYCCVYVPGPSLQILAFQTGYTHLRGANEPNPFFLHETLHHLDHYNELVLHQYTGTGGLHGANQHGYYTEGSGGETDFLKYYRVFMRGQLADLDGMLPSVNWPSIPTTADLYTGVFRTLRVYSGL